MSELFTEVASIDYPILDSDTHVNEPPDLWLDRIPARFKDRAPRIVKTEQGDIWNFDDGKGVWPVGLTAAAGMSYLDIRPFGLSYDSIRPGSFVTSERLRDMDADGIYAAVHYPSVTLKGARTYSDDPELQRCCVRAYNEWLNEFCDGTDGRLIGLGIVPTTGLDDAIADPEGAAMTALVLIEAGDNAAPDAAAILGDNLIVGVYDDAGVVIGASG